jgi:signal transduction histidine kinase
MVKHIISGHGGKIEVTSELGKGSTFTITLPALEEEGRK